MQLGAIREMAGESPAMIWSYSQNPMWVLRFRSVAFLLRGAAFAGCVLTAACGGPTVGDIEGEVLTLQVSGVYLGPKAVASGDERGDFTMSRALISVESMTLTPCSAGSGSLTFEPRVYDLLLVPPLGETVTTAVSEYCELRVDLTPSAEVTEHSGSKTSESLVLEAQDETGANVTYAGGDSPSLTFTADDNTSFGDKPLLLAFDLSAWLAYLAGEATSPLPGLFDSSLTDVAALYVDSNGNDALDDDEQTPVAHATASR